MENSEKALNLANQIFEAIKASEADQEPTPTVVYAALSIARELYEVTPRYTKDTDVVRPQHR